MTSGASSTTRTTTTNAPQDEPAAHNASRCGLHNRSEKGARSKTNHQKGPGMNLHSGSFHVESPVRGSRLSAAGWAGWAGRRRNGCWAGRAGRSDGATGAGPGWRTELDGPTAQRAGRAGRADAESPDLPPRPKAPRPYRARARTKRRGCGNRAAGRTRSWHRG